MFLVPTLPTHHDPPILLDVDDSRASCSCINRLDPRRRATLGTLRRRAIVLFEQYAQSMSLWSPDSSAFAYPGTSEDGQEGI